MSKGQATTQPPPICLTQFTRTQETGLSGDHPKSISVITIAKIEYPKIITRHSLNVSSNF